MKVPNQKWFRAMNLLSVDLSDMTIGVDKWTGSGIKKFEAEIRKAITTKDVEEEGTTANDFKEQYKEDHIKDFKENFADLNFVDISDNNGNVTAVFNPPKNTDPEYYVDFDPAWFENIIGDLDRCLKSVKDEYSTMSDDLKDVAAANKALDEYKKLSATESEYDKVIYTMVSLHIQSGLKVASVSLNIGGKYLSLYERELERVLDLYLSR